jgi:flagellar M-ring protein FliF
MSVAAQPEQQSPDRGQATPVATAVGAAPGGTLLASLARLGPARLAVLGVIALGLLGFFALLVLRAAEPSRTLLFGGLDSADAQQIVERLESLGVPYELSGAGDAILVPADQALRLRMTLAEEGLPSGGVVGYELFDRSSTFGQTDFLSNVNLRRALEGELARTIGTIRSVRAARVHLVQPDRSLFRRDQTPPSASIVVTMQGSQRLEPRQVQAIVDLVAAAVPGLQPSGVTVVDDRGNLLARGGEDGLGGLAGGAEERRTALEEHTRGKIIQLLERTLGPGRVDAQVSIELDLQQVTTTAESFDPEGQVARSAQTVEETSERSEPAANDTLTVANNLPTAAPAAGAGPAAREASRRNEETINYEISRTVRSQTQAPGAIRRMGIAVQVDGTYRPGDDGQPVFQPLPAEDLAQLEALVRSAAGVNEERGDVVEIVSRPFVAPAATETAEPGWIDLSSPLLVRAIEIGGLALTALLVALLVVRPAINRLLALGAPAGSGDPLTVIGPDGRPLLVQAPPGATIALDESGRPVIVRQQPSGASIEPAAATVEGETQTAAAGGSTAGTVRIDNVAGSVQASLVSDVAALVDARPQDVVRTIRSWLAES